MHVTVLLSNKPQILFISHELDVLIKVFLLLQYYQKVAYWLVW
jgi:hypothetical protein